MDKNTSYLKDKSTISTPKGKFAYFFLSKHSKYQNITECNIKNHLQNVLSKWHWPAFPPRTPPFRARYIVVRCGNVLMYWHGDVFYGIDNATLRRCIHPAPSTTFSPAASRLACNPTHHRHSIPSALKYQPVRCVLPVGGLCRRGADS